MVVAESQGRFCEHRKVVLSGSWGRCPPRDFWFLAQGRARVPGGHTGAARRGWRVSAGSAAWNACGICLTPSVLTGIQSCRFQGCPRNSEVPGDSQRISAECRGWSSSGGWSRTLVSLDPQDTALRAGGKGQKAESCAQRARRA